MVFCGGSTYKVFICIGSSTFPRGYQKSQFNALLSTHHSFAPPIPPDLLWGRQTLARRLQIDYPCLFALIYSPGVGCRPCGAGLWVCALIDRNDIPKHLFGIPDLDLSEDLCAEPLAGPWFRQHGFRQGQTKCRECGLPPEHAALARRF